MVVTTNPRHFSQLHISARSLQSLPSPPPPLVDTDGLVKVLSDAKTDRVLGVHIIGSMSQKHMYTPHYFML